MREYFEVSDKIYTSKDDSEFHPVEGWKPARPALWSPNLWERIMHWRGKHWSYGQAYCIMCGKERIYEKI